VTYLHAFLLGSLQGLTEFLPVSSTAHLVIASRLIGYSDPGGIFTTTIQLGSIFAVLWLYRARLAVVCLGLARDHAMRRFALSVLVAFLPALVAGALLSGYVKRVLYDSPGVIGAAFVLGGVVMLAVERYRPAATVRTAEETPLRPAFGIGLAQTLALVPGVSRSGATIVGGLLMGLERPAAAEFSFFLAIPTMTAAFVHDMLGAAGHLAPERALEIAIGFVMAFVSAALVVRPFLGYVRRSGFVPFAWYRIVVGLVLLGASAGGWH
jgi:undecaprenyl-diphosphatase